MDVGKMSKYAILLRKTEMSLHLDVDGIDDALKSEKYEIMNAGTLIQIFDTKSHTRSSKHKIPVQIIDYANRTLLYENLYECPLANLRSVSESLWPFVISIVDPEQRLRMILDTSHCNWVLNLKVNDLISVSGEMFNKSGSHYNCIIRYIGCVPELYCVGYFFGSEILDLVSGTSPQADKISVSKSYVDVNSKLLIFTTANWISAIPKEQQKPISGCDLLNGAIEKFKSAIGPSSFVTGSAASGTSSLNKKDKKSKKNKAPSSQFYDIVDNTETCINNNNITSGNKNKNNNNNHNGTMERNKKGSVNMLSSHDCEEFKQSIENREKSIERRCTTTNTAQTQTQPQNGILKNKQNAFSGNVKEIFVINDKDIDESTRQESDVFVIDKQCPQNLELMELLGNHWPISAGDAGLILNKQKSDNKAIGGTANKTNRNKTSLATSSSTKKTNDTISSISENSENRTFPNAAYESQEHLPAVLDSECMPTQSLQEVPNTDLGLGSMVEVDVPDSSNQVHGVIRWIGIPPGEKNMLIGVELDDDCFDKQFVTTDGGFKGIPLFKCPAGRGIFVASEQCAFDRRFLGAEGGAAANGSCEVNANKIKTTNGFLDDQKTFGHMECPVVPGAVAPIKCQSLDILEELCGKFKGIQGHHNSCYLDVTLFSMFAFTPVFDAILYRPPEKDDISEYVEVQKVLREEIVNPLRKNMFVRADRVMKLRELLDKLSSVSGLCSEEKDPEEFLNCLLSQIMRAEPFLKLNSGQDAYYYQLFVDKDERLSFPSVQQLFEQSFYSSDIKLKEVPSCLIIQMPRFGKSFKMYPRILPSQVLDVTDIIDDSPRQCTVCGQLAEFECRDCYGILQSGVGLETTAFCPACIESVHRHAKRANHSYRQLSVPQDFRVMAQQMTVPRLYMELFAVVCIETSHYVTFVKAGPGPDAPWCFFDSMADRKGEKNGYNIPEMITVPDLPQWLSEDGSRIVNETSSNDKMLPEHAKRLFCDAYMCMYQSTDVMMYR